MKMEENPWINPIAEQYLLGISHVIEYLKTETYKIIYNRHMQAGRSGPPPPKADKSKKASRVRA
ncbi:ras suppressor protein 1-like [Drosophila albomicans]|uniref:Ras suppressor protein 1-like n=1 Tax=Drosophila albomicans TaxID=7291 RepID=A0A6P8W649_DROAB|nr:ras suppressor protein 1-like [Drosophila albomicans]